MLYCPMYLPGVHAGVGLGVGNLVGCGVGNWVGYAVGYAVGDTVGNAVGYCVGKLVGKEVGCGVGDGVGAVTHADLPLRPAVHLPRGQLWHRRYTFWSWNLFPGHSWHIGALNHSLYVPWAHGMHETKPLRQPPNLPTMHAKHWVAASLEYWPLAQNLQNGALLAAEYVPATQFLQSAPPCPYRPGAQLGVGAEVGGGVGNGVGYVVGYGVGAGVKQTMPATLAPLTPGTAATSLRKLQTFISKSGETCMSILTYCLRLLLLSEW